MTITRRKLKGKPQQQRDKADSSLFGDNGLALYAASKEGQSVIEQLQKMYARKPAK